MSRLIGRGRREHHLGHFRRAEQQLGGFGEVRGLEVGEFGCGTAYFFA